MTIDTEKRTYNQAYREFMRGLLRFRKPQDIAVVYPPRPEDSSEVIEIYDDAGIPRENIIGLQKSHKKARDIAENVPGIELIAQGFTEFFKSTDKKFDIINLDYPGQFGQEETDTIATICKRELINPGGILVTHFFGSREKKDMQQVYSIRANEHRDSQILAQDLIGRLQGASLKYHVSELREGLQDSRDDGISLNLLTTILGNGPGFFFSQLIDKPFFQNFVLRMFPDADFKNIDQIKELTHTTAITTALRSSYFEELRKMPEFEGVSDKALMDNLDFMIISEEKPYMILEHERYSYPTEGGRARMFCDFLRLGKEWHKDKWTNNSITFDVDGEILKAKHGYEPVSKLRKKTRKYITTIGRAYLPDFMPERVELVSFGDEPRGRTSIIQKHRLG